MSYNPFDDLPPEAAKEEGEEMEKEQASKRRKIDESIAECKDEVTVNIKTEEPPQPKKVDVPSTLQTLRKHIFNSKYEPLLQLTPLYLSPCITLHSDWFLYS